MQDHPCVCREKYKMSNKEIIRAGSPLRVQGKDTFLTSNPIDSRITPACAGKSSYKNRRLNKYQDHPCVCREKRLSKHCAIDDTGSPLRVQGKGSRYWTLTSTSRITPACAGKSPKNPLTAHECKDHPCVCREK